MYNSTAHTILILGGAGLNSKAVVFVISFVAFAALFISLDHVLQKSQGLELFPTKQGH